MSPVTAETAPPVRAPGWEMPILAFEQVPPSSYFDSQAPVEIEIGCGKGRFLLARAAQCPDINFLGLDRANKWMKIGKDRGEKRGLANLKFIRTECRDFLSRLQPETVSAFHMYFPDPWPKRRHQKRRTLCAEFLGLLNRLLVPGGCIQIATDHADYFQEIRAAADWTAAFWRSRRESMNQRLAHAEIKTNYELKYEAGGRPLYYLELVKQ